jgi:hypothetical protein
VHPGTTRREKLYEIIRNGQTPQKWKRIDSDNQNINDRLLSHIEAIISQRGFVDFNGLGDMDVC